MSSSLILVPSYKNLPTPKWYVHAVKLKRTQGEKHDQSTILKANRQRAVIRTVFVNVPDGLDVFSNLGCIRRLKLQQLRILLDFKKDFLSGGRQNLQIRHRHEKRHEIEAKSVSIRDRIVPPTYRSRGRTLILIGPESGGLPPSSLGTLSAPLSDMIQRLSVEVDEFKYQETPSAARVVAEGQRSLLRNCSSPRS